MTGEVRVVRAASAATWHAFTYPTTAPRFAASFAATYANYGKKHGDGGTWRTIG